MKIPLFFVSRARARRQEIRQSAQLPIKNPDLICAKFFQKNPKKVLTSTPPRGIILSQERERPQGQPKGAERKVLK